MSQSPNAHTTARRNLAQRIGLLLLAAPVLTGWQAKQVRYY